jgi:hypothetical protein
VADKLTDPSKPAQAIIEVLEDGDALRNDGVRLTAANKNPWYVLATIYGEQEEGATWLDHDKALAQKNRSVWERWTNGSLQATNDEVEITNLFRSRMGDKTAELPSRRKEIDFSKTFFPTSVCFINYEFLRDCEFIEAHFAKNVLFNSSKFAGNALFIEATFQGIADFRHASFERAANFRSASFMGVSLFDFAEFKSNVCFQSATFHLGTGFTETVFAGETQFDWYGSDDFGFEKARHAVRFFGIAVFDSAKFQAKTRFTDAQFLTHVPEFHAAELYDDTVFPTPDKYTDNWPKLKGDGVMPAADQKRAYNRLRLFMNKSLQIDEEQFFHRQEMRCKTVLAEWYHKPFYWLFALLSDYGNSVWRPLLWMIFVMLSGALFMLWWQEAFTFLPKEASGFDWTMGLLGEDDPLAKPREAAGWSILNTLPFLGFGKLYYGELAKELAWPLKVVGGVQTVFGFVLLFFLGLGLRNRFRLR